MEPNNLALIEVVVVGSGSQKKKDLTGSVANIAINAPFGENELIKYYQSHRKTKFCNLQKVVLKVKFYIGQLFILHIISKNIVMNIIYI